MNFTGRNFLAPFLSLNGTFPFPITVLDVARASLTVGYGGGYAPSGAALWLPFHMAHFSIPIFLLGPYSSPSFIRPFVATMPMSLRRYASERLAMAITKVWADRFVGIPWLAEVEFLERTGAIAFTGASRIRPDLVGQDGFSDWHVIEAKARLNSTSVDPVLVKAKTQAGYVSAIQGKVPKLTVGCVLHLQAGLLHLSVDDPHPDNQSPVKAEVRTEVFYATYYDGVRGLLSSGDQKTREHGKRVYSTVKLLPGPNSLSLGLLKPIRDDVMKGVKLLRKEPIQAKESELQSIGLDGTALFVD